MAAQATSANMPVVLL